MKLNYKKSNFTINLYKITTDICLSTIWNCYNLIATIQQFNFIRLYSFFPSIYFYPKT